MLFDTGPVQETYIVCYSSCSGNLYCLLQVLSRKPILFAAGSVQETYVV